MASINSFYKRYAAQLMSLNLDEGGLFISIPSERDDNKFYRVDLIEETMQAEKCECWGFCRWSKCKHCTITNEAFANYKPVPPTPVAEPKITEAEAGEWYIVNSDTQVWQVNGAWMAVGATENAIEIVAAHLEKQEAVAEAEKIVAAPHVEKVAEPHLPVAMELQGRGKVAKSVDIGTKGNLNGNKGFSILKIA